MRKFFFIVFLAHFFFLFFAASWPILFQFFLRTKKKKGGKLGSSRHRVGLCGSDFTYTYARGFERQTPFFFFFFLRKLSSWICCINGIVKKTAHFLFFPNYKWTSSLDTSAWNMYTFCGRLNQNVAQREWECQMEFLNMLTYKKISPPLRETCSKSSTGGVWISNGVAYWRTISKWYSTRSISTLITQTDIHAPCIDSMFKGPDNTKSW